MTALVAVHGLTKRFGPLLAVAGLEFNVERGEVLGFLGPNGSGKSTTMRMLTGFLEPSAGSARIGGIDVQANPVLARRRLGYLAEGAPAYPEMTPLGFLSFVAAAHGLRGTVRRDAVARVVALTNIESVLHQPMDTLSKGYKRRVGLAQALIHDPDVLLLDEPTDGLDPNQKHEVRSLIAAMAPSKAIIISTHILEEVHAVCTRAMVIAEGQTIADGTPEALQARSRHYNAVSVTLPAAASDLGRDLLDSVEGVHGVEQCTVHEKRVRLTALSEHGRNILPGVWQRLRATDLPIEQVQLESGNLDEVFRTLTRDDRALAAGCVAASAAARSGGTDTSAHGVVRDALTVCRRELLGYFATPIAYVFIVIFLAAVGALTFFAGDFFKQDQASLDTFFQFHPWLYLFLIPALAMRLWAEERRTGSIELLLTLPISTAGAVLGKFFAAWTVAGVSLALTVSIWITANYLGSPDNGVIVAGYAGSFMMAGTYLAVGAFVSALTRSQVIAFIVAAAACFILTAAGLRVVLDVFGDWAPVELLPAIASFSILEHFRAWTRGVVDARSVAFFVSTIVFFLFATAVCVERNKHA